MDAVIVTMIVFFYNLYIKIYTWFNPMPKQLFKYENGNIYINGYCGYDNMKLRIDHFKINGDYSIIINNDPIRYIKKSSLGGFDNDTTYFLTTNNIVLDKEAKIEIKDNILDIKKKFTISSGKPINYLALIKEMDD